jgi:hypothetical protein
MTIAIDGSHISLDCPVCAGCYQARPVKDCVSADNLIAALGIYCPGCDLVTVLRYVLDPSAREIAST